MRTQREVQSRVPAAVRESLEGEAGGQNVSPGTAVLLGDRQAAEPEPAAVVPHVPVEPALTVALGCPRGDDLVCEVADARDERLLLLGQGEVHAFSVAAGRGGR
jgi:hypothetical protein